MSYWTDESLDALEANGKPKEHANYTDLEVRLGSLANSVKPPATCRLRSERRGARHSVRHSFHTGGAELPKPNPPNPL